MPELQFLLPGDPETRTGGYIYDKRILAGLSSLGWSTVLHRLDPRFPSPSAEALEQAQAVMQALPAGALVVIDGLALGGMPALVERHAERFTLVALFHHALAAETGLERADRERFSRHERQALAAVSRVIVPSLNTAAVVADYGVAEEKIGLVTPGTDPAPLARGSGGPGVALLCVATITPRKGHAVLVEALAGLSDRNWSLTCVGSLTRSPETAATLRRLIAQLGLGRQVHLIGEVAPEALDDFYDRADLFVLPSYLEGYGMALAEALARGLPVISTRAGAIPETVPEGAGMLVPPGDSVALRTALTELFDSPETRRRLSEAARDARRRLPDWSEASARFAMELEKAVHS